MNNPVVSIIVPVYNASKTLRRCVDSVLKQEFPDFELLLVDDGSQDGSGAICDEYAALDHRVRVVHKENAGVSAARNDALDRAQGVFLQFLDSDDWITPDATKLLVRSAREHSCDMVVSDFYRVSGELCLPHDGKPSRLLLRCAVEQALPAGDRGGSSSAHGRQCALVRGFSL